MRMGCIFLGLFFLVLVNTVSFAQSAYLEIPVFPGAREMENARTSYAGANIGVKTYETTASFEKVVDFYRQGLPEALFSSMGDEEEKNAVFQMIEAAGIKVVTISQVKGERAKISIMRQS